MDRFHCILKALLRLNLVTNPNVPVFQRYSIKKIAQFWSTGPPNFLLDLVAAMGKTDSFRFALRPYAAGACTHERSAFTFQRLYP